MSSNMFSTPSGLGNRTPVHGFPLPTTKRQYEPEYSRGQYVLTNPITGVERDKFTRVTTAAHSLDNGSGLDAWKMSNVVLGLKQKPELLDDIDLFDEPYLVRRTVKNVVETACEIAGAKEAAERGTAIHAWTEVVDSGEATLSDVPGEFAPYVRAYQTCLHEKGIRVVPGMIERTVFNATTGWVGTCDRIYELADGTHVIGDVKTSKTTSIKYSYLGFSIQMATYATATHMLTEDGKEWVPMPPVGTDYAVIMHLPSNDPGKCTPITIDLAAGIEAMQEAMRVMAMQKTAGKIVPDPVKLPAPSLTRRIDLIQSVEELSALWEANQQVWTDDLTQRGLGRLQALGLA